MMMLAVLALNLAPISRSDLSSLNGSIGTIGAPGYRYIYFKQPTAARQPPLIYISAKCVAHIYHSLSYLWMGRQRRCKQRQARGGGEVVVVAVMTSGRGWRE